MKREVRSDYSKEYDILSFNWGKVDNSRELLDDRIVFDFDKEGNVVGFEFFDFRKALEESQKKVEEIFKLAENRGNKSV